MFSQYLNGLPLHSPGGIGMTPRCSSSTLKYKESPEELNQLIALFQYTPPRNWVLKSAVKGSPEALQEPVSDEYISI